MGEVHTVTCAVYLKPVNFWRSCRQK